MHLNVQSLISKLEEIEILLHTSSIDFFCVSEHWLPYSLPNIGENFINVASFNRQKFKNDFL